MTVVDPDPNLAGRISASVTNWKRKLLDVSRRNRALNFRPTKVSTIAIVDEPPSEVFKRIYIDEGTMRFLPAEPRQKVLEPAFERTASVADETLDVDTDTDQGLQYVPYDP